MIGYVSLLPRSRALLRLFPTPPTRTDVMIDLRQSTEWEHIISEDGAMYFHNPRTGEASWQRPVPPGVTADRSGEGSGGGDAGGDGGAGGGRGAAGSSTLPQGWEELLSAEGHPYYFNETTGETRWEPPDPPEPVPLEAAATQETAASEQ